RHGGVRLISAPSVTLRKVQKWILRNILRTVKIHDAATAYRNKRSILHNAAHHTGKDIVVRIDLKDFLHSINYERVKRIFLSLGYQGDISEALAALTTASAHGWNRHLRYSSEGPIRYTWLPQGAPTSPAISNIVCLSLDTILSKMDHVTYTRYADDLVFSWNLDEVELSVGSLLGYVRRIVGREGFSINPEKTRVMRRAQRQIVNGLIVNAQSPRVSRSDMRRFRVLLHHIESEGVEVVTEKLGCDALAHANGIISYVYMINPEQARRLSKKHSWLGINRLASNRKRDLSRRAVSYARIISKTESWRKRHSTK
ncbi:MAG: reverse transcriptase family protein, partial [Thermomicrobiales bacterium]